MKVIAAFSLVLVSALSLAEAPTRVSVADLRTYGIYIELDDVQPEDALCTKLKIMMPQAHPTIPEYKDAKVRFQIWHGGAVLTEASLALAKPLGDIGTHYRSSVCLPSANDFRASIFIDYTNDFIKCDGKGTCKITYTPCHLNWVVEDVIQSLKPKNENS